MKEGKVKCEPDLLVCPRCGWTGNDLKKTGCLSDADEWYVCPRCNLVGSEMRRDTTHKEGVRHEC